MGNVTEPERYQEATSGKYENLSYAASSVKGITILT